MQRYVSLEIWQLAHALAKRVYEMTRDFPSDERFGLTSQLRRAALSVPTNIAEGSQRGRGQAFGNFLSIAAGSLAETEYLILFANEMGYISAQHRKELFAAVTKLAPKIRTLQAQAYAVKTSSAKNQLTASAVRPD